MATTQEIIKDQTEKLEVEIVALNSLNCTKNQEKELKELKAATKELSTRLLHVTEELKRMHDETVQFRKREQEKDAQVIEQNINTAREIKEMATQLLHVTEELKASERRNANTRVHMERLIAEQENNLHNLISCFTCK